SRGDRIGLIGRNGAGKTTLFRALAGEAELANGRIYKQGTLGYLSQDPMPSDKRQHVRDRILSALDLDVIVRKMRQAQEAMASAQSQTQARALRNYPRLEERFIARGGWAAE